MCKKARIVSMLLFALAIAYGSAAARQGVIKAEKRALIKEIMTLTRADQLAESFAMVMLAQLEKDLPATLSSNLPNDLTPQERKAMEERVKESYARVSKKFRERLPAAINFAEVIEEISYPLYYKFFTEDELKDLIAFYKTTTGKKSIEVMPQLGAEAVQRTGILVTPKLTKLMKEIMQEEGQRRE